MKQVLLIDTMHPVFSEALSEAGFELVDGTSWNRNEILSRINKFEGAVIRSRISIDKDFMDAATNLKFIARAGAGMESIDVLYAEKKNILCLNSPEGNRDAVAEHALGMLLSLMNKLNKADHEVRNHQWIREANRGTELVGKKVGIIGFGNTGEAFARRLAGFNVTVLVFDKYRKISNNEFADLVQVHMEKLLEEADIVSLHVPLTAETEYLVNDSFIKGFKKNIYLINTSRGKVVNTVHLVQAIKSGKITGACLDVNEYEDSSFEKSSIGASPASIPDAWKYLLNSDKVILTPHIAGWTHESLRKIAEVLAGKIKKAYTD